MAQCQSAGRTADPTTALVYDGASSARSSNSGRYTAVLFSATCVLYRSTVLYEIVLAQWAGVPQLLPACLSSCLSVFKPFVNTRHLSQHTTASSSPHRSRPCLPPLLSIFCPVPTTTNDQSRRQSASDALFFVFVLVVYHSSSSFCPASARRQATATSIRPAGSSDTASDAATATLRRHLYTLLVHSPPLHSYLHCYCDGYDFSSLVFSCLCGGCLLMLLQHYGDTHRNERMNASVGMSDPNRCGRASRRQRRGSGV